MKITIKLNYFRKFRIRKSVGTTSIDIEYYKPPILWSYFVSVSLWELAVFIIRDWFKPYIL